MGVRFVVGRAGSGKTHHCLSAIRGALRDDPIDGPRLVLLVPEQASLQMERAVLDPAEIPGAHRAEVLSFQRLAYRVLETVGGPQRRALSEPARAMALRHVIRRRSRELRYFRRPERLGALIKRLAATIAELIVEAVEPADLAGAAEDAGADDPAQTAKLHDLHLLYSAYLDYLGNERLDPSQNLLAVRAHLRECAWLSGADLWVDGFASFSGQETLTLLALADMCRQTEITLLLEPALHKSQAGTASDSHVAQLFRTTQRTYLDLGDKFARTGHAIEDPLRLHPNPTPRFKRCAALQQLEASLFSAPLVAERRNANAPAGVELVELPSRRLEVDYAVSRIRRWTQDPALRCRYRDVALIVRGLEPYHDLLRDALSARGIPFFIDRRRPTAHHPLVELLRGAVAIASEDLSIGAIRLVLKTGLLPLEADACDELENYALAHGLSGREMWDGENWAFAPRTPLVREAKAPDGAQAAEIRRVNATRRAFLDLVRPWLNEAAGKRPRTGPQWVGAVVQLLENLKAGNTLTYIAGQAERDGNVDLAAEHRQVWQDTSSLLEDFAFAFEKAELSLEELGEVLEQGLADLTLGLAPPMLDQVLVGSIERSRHPSIRAAVVLGCNDGVFPRRPEEDALLNDDDRAVLRLRGARTSPSRRDRVLDESFLFYVAMTRASDSLVVTYPLADEDGKALKPSPFLADLKVACAGLETATISDPGFTRATWNVLSFKDLAARTVAEFRTRPALSRDDVPLRKKWNGLYESARPAFAEDAVLRTVLTSLAEPPPARLSPAFVKKLLHADALRASVSQLETYAACPFQHFARHGLRLRQREEAELAPVDVGHVHHAILEDFVRGLVVGQGRFSELSDSDVLERLAESCTRISARLPEGGVMSDARNAYILRRSASFLARVIRAQRKASRSGRASPRAAELPFGFDDEAGLPALEISTPRGRDVLLRGYIDRVDLAEIADELLGTVIDYKRTRDKHLELARVYHGLSLQLVGYLLVLADQGATLTGRPIRPVAALYVSLAPKYQLVDHPDTASPRELETGGATRPRGILSEDAADVIDGAGGRGWSDVYSIYRKKDGGFGYPDQSDVSDRPSFDALMEHVRTKLGSLADGILDGDIAVRPYRLGTFSPCSWCAFGAVCRFEMGISDVRFLETLKRSEVFQRLTGAAT